MGLLLAHSIKSGTPGARPVTARAKSTFKLQTDTFVELRKKLAPARCFEEFIVELPHIRAAFPERLQDPVLLLQALLLDVPDPYGKIAEAIPALAVDRDWLAGTLLHAEAWLTLQAQHKRGGSRRGRGDTPETDSVK